MKTIVLVRHAKAVNRIGDVADYYRSLKKKGQSESKIMADKFIFEGLKPDLLISSPANRAQETAIIFAQELNYAIEKIQYEETIYFATNGSRFIDFVANCNTKCNTIMLFGHEPTISEFAAYLIKGFNYGFPKTAILAVDFDIRTWDELLPGQGQQRFFLVPDDKNIDNYRLI